MFITNVHNILKFYCLNSYGIHDNYFFFWLHHHPLKDLIANNYQLYKSNPGGKIEKDVHSINYGHEVLPVLNSTSCTKSRMVIIHNRAEQNGNACTYMKELKIMG